MRSSVSPLWVVAGWLLAGIAVGAQAQETQSRATKPASTAASAAKPAPDAAASTAQNDAKGDARDDAKDDEFLEFLGSVDADATDEDWLDYLAQTDILKVAKAKKAQPAEGRRAEDKTGK